MIENQETLAKIKEANPNLNDIIIDGNLMYFNGQSIDISNFSISSLMSDELPFANDLTTLTSEDVFKIISLHALTVNSKEKDDIDKAKEELNIKDSGKMNAHVFYKNDEFGKRKQYINVVDSTGRNNVFVNDVPEIYENIEIFVESVNSTENINAEELCRELNRKFKNVRLEDTYDLLHSEKTSKDFTNKINNFESQHKNDKHFAVGNEEEDILISNDHTVASYERDADGNLIQENFANNSNNEQGSNPTDETSDTTDVTPNVEGSEQNRDTFLNNDVDQFVAIKLISFEKFENLINSIEEHTEQEEYEIGLFNSYLGELMLYRDYLLPDLRDVLSRFESLMEKFEVAEENTLNQNQTNELNKYHELAEKNEITKNEKRKLDMDLMVKKLEYQKPDINGGKVKTKVLIIIMLVVLALLAVACVTLVLIN